MVNSGWWMTVGQRLGTFALSGVFLWQVALCAEPQECELIVHLSESDVEVKVDGRVYPIDPTPGSPIVCGLGPGNHSLTMSRSGQELYREEFATEPGDQIVLTAWDQTRPVARSIPIPALGRDPIRPRR